MFFGSLGRRRCGCHLRSQQRHSYEARVGPCVETVSTISFLSGCTAELKIVQVPVLAVEEYKGTGYAAVNFCEDLSKL